MDYFMTEEKERFIDGECGKIQAGFTEGKNQDVAVLAWNPHPQYQATMFNKVITTVMRAAKKKKLSCLRFNYRGVGKSQGSYAGGIGEANDALAAARWLLNETGCSRIWLVGFSFGGAVAYRVQKKLACQGVLLICPSIESEDMKESMNCPLWVLQAEDDQVIDPKKVSQWSCEVGAKELIFFQRSGHFFHGKLSELQSKLEDLLMV